MKWLSYSINFLPLVVQSIRMIEYSYNNTIITKITSHFLTSMLYASLKALAWMFQKLVTRDS